MTGKCFSKALFRAAANLILAIVVFYGGAESGAQELGQSKIDVNLGVIIIYDQDFQHQIIHAQMFQKNMRKGEKDYLAALLKAAELRFLDVEEIKLTLTLMNAWNRMELAEPASSQYHKALDGAKTMNRVQLEIKQNSRLYSEADIVVFVTGQEVITKAERAGWLGVAQRAQVCQNKVALVSDNGKTFTGTDSLASQIALLLNASRDEIDNTCNKSDSFLLSSIYGGFKSNFSKCSKDDMVSFLRETDPSCWKEQVPDYYHGELPANYHNTTGYDICTVYHNDNNDIKTCLAQDSEPRRKKICGVQCCDYYRLRNPFFYMQTAADGSPCGDEQICIAGQCLEYQH